MRVLVIGGTRFVGLELTFRLLARGHDVTLLNRGSRSDPFGNRVTRLVADRTTKAFDSATSGLTFDAAVDFAAFTGEDARRAVRALGGRIGHYVLISTGQVYLVRDRKAGLAVETDYHGKLISEPTGEHDKSEFLYGIGKRDAEDVLREAWSQKRFPATALRIPMVNGPRDHYRRIESYIVRMIDGGPLLLPDGGGAPARHVYSTAIARAIVDLLGREATFGRAYNLAQDEVPQVRELVAAIALALGATPTIIPVAREKLIAAGLDAEQVSPFSGTWMSYLDPTRAKTELGFRHEPLAEYLRATIAGLLAVMTGDRPAGYTRRREELRLAEGV
jgi:nucleoside-diphosphate-sugar epimerase